MACFFLDTVICSLFPLTEFQIRTIIRMMRVNTASGAIEVILRIYCSMTFSLALSGANKTNKCIYFTLWSIKALKKIQSLVSHWLFHLKFHYFNSLFCLFFFHLIIDRQVSRSLELLQPSCSADRGTVSPCVCAIDCLSASAPWWTNSLSRFYPASPRQPLSAGTGPAPCSLISRDA